MFKIYREKGVIMLESERGKLRRGGGGRYHHRPRRDIPLSYQTGTIQSPQHM